MNVVETAWPVACSFHPPFQVVCTRIASGQIDHQCFQQYMDEPQVLWVYHFAFIWILSIAVAGALLGQLVLFRELLTRVEG